MKTRMIVGPPPLKYLKKYGKGGTLSPFEKAFAQARKEKGANATFTYNGKVYTTQYKEEVGASKPTATSTAKAPVFTGSSFNEAFAKARQTLGAGKTFEYNGKLYGTNYATEVQKPTATKPKTEAVTKKELPNGALVNQRLTAQTATAKPKADTTYTSSISPVTVTASKIKKPGLSTATTPKKPAVLLDKPITSQKSTPVSTTTSKPVTKPKQDTTFTAKSSPVTVTASRIVKEKPTAATTQKPVVDENEGWIKRIMEFESTKGSKEGTGLPNFGYNTRNPKSMNEAVKYFKQDYLPKVKNLPLGVRERHADFLYNAGENLDLYMVDRYLTSKTGQGIPNRGEYRKAGAKNKQFATDYADAIKEIRNLPVLEQTKLADQARDFYYRNINTINGKPNPTYEKSWSKRVNMFNESTPKKSMGGLIKKQNGGQLSNLANTISAVGGIASAIPGVGAIPGAIASVAAPILQAVSAQQAARSSFNKMYSSTPMMAKGGLIKRKDGSYSQRGLWDNIRANKGSGKKPTKQMLEQERKIKAKMEFGGTLQGADDLTFYKGRKHSTGGIMVSAKGTPAKKAVAEVEGGETRYLRKGGTYIFSDKLLV